MRKIVYLLMMLIFAFGCSNQKEKEISQRKAAVDSWIEAAEEVAVKSNSNVAVQIIEFLKGSTYLIVPVRHDVSDGLAYELGRDIPKKEYTIGITCLTKKDRELGEAWDKFVSSKNHAFLYIPEGSKDASLLFLKDADISNFWKGMVLIHEAGHAIAHYSGMLEGVEESDLRNAFYELEVYTLEDQMLEAVGKEKYKAILDREVQRLRDEIRKKKLMIPRYDLYLDELDEIFGKAQSQAEINLRADVIWFNAMLKMYDKQFKPENAQNMKLAFMIDVHKNRHIR